MYIFGEYEVTSDVSNVSYDRVKTELDSSIRDYCFFYTKLFTNRFVLNCNKGIPDSYDPLSTKVTFSSGDKSKVFTLEPLTNSGLDNSLAITSIETYPDSQSIQDLKLFGYGRGSVLLFKTNSAVYKRFFYLKLNGLQLIFQNYPIYGDDSSTTYLAPLGIGSNLYDLYYFQTNRLIKANSNQIKTHVTDYSLVSIPTIGLNTPVYSTSIPVLTLTFTDNKKYDFQSIEYCVFNQDFPITAKFPFGYFESSPGSYSYQASFLLKPQYSSTANIYYTPLSQQTQKTIPFQSFDTSFNYDQALAPTIYNAEKYHLENHLYLLKLSIVIPYNFNYILCDKKHFGVESLVYGHVNDGVYELTNFGSEISVVDQVFSRFYSRYGDILAAYGQNVEIHQEAPFFNLDYSIKNVSFLYNNIDVTGHRHYNVLYFNYSNAPKESVFRLVPISSLNDHVVEPVLFFSTFNETLKLFQIEFYVDSNVELGEYSFFLTINPYTYFISSSNLETKLIIKKSNMDFQGPMFREIKKIIPGQLNENNLVGTIGWDVTIEDQVNGFDRGYVVIKGEIDQSTYNISLDLSKMKSGNRFLGQYHFGVDISYPCLTQNYVIDEVKLYDKGNRVSNFSTLLINYSSIFNPFLYFLNSTTINKIQLTCGSDSNDDTPPVLDSFVVSPETEIDVSTKDRTITFTFGATDPESGIKNNTYPIVYISNSNNQIIECVSKILQISNKEAKYTCSKQLPVGFGYPGKLIYSVFGLINNVGLYSGYPAKTLSEKTKPYYIETKYTTEEPLIIGTLNTITDRGGNLWLTGKKLLKAQIGCVMYNENTVQNPVSTQFSTVIKVPILPTKKPFEIFIITESGNTNSLIITPQIYDGYFIECNNNGVNNGVGCTCPNKWTTLDFEKQCAVPNHYIISSTQVSSTTGGEITLYGWFGSVIENQKLFIDNKEVAAHNISPESIKTTIGPGKVGPVQFTLTQNSVQWSGLLYPYEAPEKECPIKCNINGECDKTTGICKCNPKFTGFDCSSPINEGNEPPKTETEVGNNGSTVIRDNEVGFAISIESIVELDLNNNVVSTHNLSSVWDFIKKVDTVSSFNQKRINDDNTNATIGLVVEEVIGKDKDFIFAGNQFTVSKGGLKITLSISNWLYKSNLNRLQVQMSSDISISNDNCNSDNENAMVESSSQYLSNNINYLKISKNKRVLYAKFQDKMLANDRPTTITTQLLSKNETSVKISLNLPHCEECLIDPDFSLLISQDYKFDCQKSKNWIIAVAVVAGVVGLALIFIASFIIYKKSTFLKIKVYAFKKHLKQ
ncbi:hypothetical protein DICPUDRAFT_155773 [Dictyostelium purpureum]|uniref:EGF-like domain-containing protein n=1 Tax=Dictyostelium purpureum TaxID=5786 RepID=F0ZUU7_DICPU|nr:uncharacterized protein DICPUDRAFT_155773 [Dictyostelium purpureum]EGC32279.1 hypothetical protein DICPUDRAFT_155773 [Dictyostelium purpureum]|eukprot:XP_003291188.1 hypothetical protein DICPUDRAFT_155773 [Dictyostelium purpureum]